MRITRIHRRRCYASFIAFVAIGIVGCGESNRPKTIPIAGVLTIDGKEPGESGTLFFIPTKSAEGIRPGPPTATSTRKAIIAL